MSPRDVRISRRDSLKTQQRALILMTPKVSQSRWTHAYVPTRIKKKKIAAHAQQYSLISVIL